jgi:hypothetical protein
MAGMTPDSHWVRWHESYRDPASPLSVRLGLVQALLRDVLDSSPAAAPIRIVSLCAGQGRDVIDVVAGHPRRADVSARLVELDPTLVAFARDRAESAGVVPMVQVVEGDASAGGSYVGAVPADVVLVCGVFGNLGDDDVARTVGALPGLCSPGANVIWTRHRRPPDRTPIVRRLFEEAGFEEVAFEAPPDPYVLTVGRHRLVGRPGAFDPDATLFEFVGDGSRPA